MSSNTAEEEAVIRSDMAAGMQVSAVIVPRGRLIRWVRRRGLNCGEDNKPDLHPTLR